MELLILLKTKVNPRHPLLTRERGCGDNLSGPGAHAHQLGVNNSEHCHRQHDPTTRAVARPPPLPRPDGGL